MINSGTDKASRRRGLCHPVRRGGRCGGQNVWHLGGGLLLTRLSTRFGFLLGEIFLTTRLSVDYGCGTPEYTPALPKETGLVSEFRLSGCEP